MTDAQLQMILEMMQSLISGHVAAPPAPVATTSARSPAMEQALAKISQDTFSRALRGQPPLTDAEIRGVFLEQVIGPDLADALVSKPERQDELRAKYGPGWVEGGYDPNALLAMIVVRQRQVAMWNLASNMPGEPLSRSVLFARYNQWATNGNSIKDALNHDPNVIPTIPPGEPGYRIPPGQPGYSGPYWS